MKLVFCVLFLTAGSQALGQIQVDAKKQLTRLLTVADTDHDKKITVMDRNATFYLRDLDGHEREVSGHYYLSNLLQELKLAADQNTNFVLPERVFENPVDRISRSIRSLYWDGLTRRVDERHLAQILEDEKLPRALSQMPFRNLYVPADDDRAFQYFSKASREQPALKMKVWRLPKTLDANEMHKLEGRHGVLTLALRPGAEGKLEGVPFVVPGGRFNEMYGWDSYFESLGLLVDGRTDLAKAMVDNFVYEIESYGKILNANRSYYLNRSQPPFLTSMIAAVYKHLDKTPEAKTWLQKSLAAAIQEYQTVWMSPDRLTETGLSSYAGSGKTIPPEVEKGHFDFVLKPAARRHKLSVAKLVEKYNSGDLTDAALDDFFSQDRAVRESGHDTTYRWTVGHEDRAADFVTVDLNSLLYKFELDLARLVKAECGDSLSGTTSEEWRKLAARRKAAMLKYLWDDERKIFFDYDYKRAQRSRYISATSFYPLWAQDPTDPSSRLLSQADAETTVTKLLAALETLGGLTSTARVSLESLGDAKHARQWEYPNGWAPHQMIAWTALRNYGMTNAADRLTYKWLYTIASNAAKYNGTIPEKFDVVHRSHAVFAEYGNVGTQFSYITKEGFGWMNASFQVGLQELSKKWRPELEALRPPEWVGFETK